LLAVGGKELYMKSFKDKDLSGPQFRKTLETFKKLKGYVDAASPGRDWNLATGMVIEGKAGFQFMGDWAKGEFVSANKTAGKEFGCFMAGGPKMPYAIGGDVFVFPKNNKPDAVAAQKKLAELMISPAVQVAFNNKKGSIPIRTDVDLSGIDVCAAAGVLAIKENRLLESNNELLSPDANGAFEDAVSKFWNSNQSSAKAFTPEALKGASAPFLSVLIPHDPTQKTQTPQLGIACSTAASGRHRFIGLRGLGPVEHPYCIHQLQAVATQRLGGLDAV
jgi:glucose/mannose transport system substrate-binding protein